MKKDKAAKKDKKHKKHKNDEAGVDNGGQPAAEQALTAQDEKGKTKEHGNKHHKKEKNGKNGDAAAAVAVAGNGSTEQASAPAVEKLTGKGYAKELREAPRRTCQAAGVGQGHGRQGLHRVRGPRRAPARAARSRRITERVSPRVFRVVALPAPTEREKIADVHPALHAALPGGRRDRDLRPQLVQPRRRRAGDGLLHRRSRSERFLELVPAVEKAMVDSGIILLKYWLEVSREEQTRRLERRIDDPRKIWKLSPMDLKSYSRWYDYSRARDDDVRRHRHRRWRRGTSCDSDDKKRARLNIISHLLSQIPYEERAAGKGEAAQAPGRRRLQGSQLLLQAGAGEVLRKVQSSKFKSSKTFKVQHGAERILNFEL